MNTKLAILILKETKTRLIDASTPSNYGEILQQSPHICNALRAASNYYEMDTTPVSLAKYSPITLRRTVNELRAWVSTQLGEVTSVDALVFPLIRRTVAMPQRGIQQYARRLAYRIRLSWIDSMINELETRGEKFITPTTGMPLVTALANNSIVRGELAWASGVAPEFSLHT